MNVINSPLRLLSIVILGIALFAGCVTVGPDYSPPETIVSPTWHTPLKGGLTGIDGDKAIVATWWTTLDDPVLSGLIDRAVAHNLDLRTARARIRQARALRGVAVAGLFPTLDATGSFTRSRSSENLISGDTGFVTSGSSLANLFSTGFDAAWEVDIFGGVRRSIEAAEGDLGATEENLRDVLVSLLAEVARNYIDVRTYQARIHAAESNLGAQKETLDLARWRSEAGLSDELAVAEARYNMENTRSQIPALRTGLETAMNRIAVLLGEQPGTVHGELKEPQPIPAIPPSVAVGVPAETLRRRPDVRKAERILAAETARVGVATAALYPKLVLNGSIGLESVQSNNLFQPGSTAWNFGPQITWPLFRGGALRRKIEAQSAVQEQAAIAYESTVLGALEEVENVLTAYGEEQRRLDALTKAEQAAREAVRMAEQKYQAGLINFIVVLDAQRSLLSFQEQAAQSRGTVTANLVKLYKALGGGWENMEKKNETGK